SDPNIEVVGPRGSGYGHQLLREWLARAGLQLETLRVFLRGNLVVLAQHGVWRSAETREGTGEKDVASVFRVDGQRVVKISRHEWLDDALADAGFSDKDELNMPLQMLQTIPLLRIFSVEKAREFYVGFLGFGIDWEHRFDETAPMYMQVSRANC